MGNKTIFCLFIVLTDAKMSVQWGLMECSVLRPASV